MCLQHYRRSVFLAGSGRYEHRYVADGIGLYVYIVFGCEVQKEFADFFLFFRGTGHLIDLVEDREDERRLQIFNCHCLYLF